MKVPWGFKSPSSHNPPPQPPHHIMALDETSRVLRDDELIGDHP